MDATQANREPASRRPRGCVIVGYTADIAGRSALRFGVAEAALRRGRLRVVHQLVGTEVPDRFGAQRDAEEAVRRGRADVLRSLADLAGSVSDVEVSVTTEPITDELLRESVSADLLVLGLTHRTAAGALLLDSVPLALLHHARCPVLLVPPSADPEAISGVVCGTDGSVNSLDALGWSAHEAGLRGVSVLARHVRPMHSCGHAPQPSLTEWVQAQGLEAPTTIICHSAHGHSVARALLEEADHTRSLLAIGSDPQCAHHRCGGILRQVAGQTRVPVVVVPRGAHGSRSDAQEPTTDLVGAG